MCRICKSSVIHAIGYCTAGQGCVHYAIVAVETVFNWVVVGKCMFRLRKEQISVTSLACIAFGAMVFSQKYMCLSVLTCVAKEHNENFANHLV